MLSLVAGMGMSVGLGNRVYGNGGVAPDNLAYQRYWDEAAEKLNIKLTLDYSRHSRESG